LIEDSRANVRCAAIQGLALIGDLEAIERRLDDPIPEVAASAALALVDLGQGTAVASRRPDDPNLVRRAAVAAATGATDTATVAELAVALMHQLDDLDDSDGLAGSPLLAALTASLFTTPDGLHRAAALLGGIPEALPIIALAVPRDDDQQPGVIAPPGPRAELEQSIADALTDDSEGRAIGLGLLAGLSCGDVPLAAQIAAALDTTDGYAGQLLVALAELRVRTADGAAALAPLLAGTAPHLGRIYAAAAAGRVLPIDHAAWTEVRALLELGTVARAAAWSSLRDRARYT
jgi:hypothetical protein